MRFNSLSQVGCRAPIIWLQVTLSGRLDAAAVAAWQLRLRTFLRNRRLLSAVAPRRIAVLPPGASATPFERGVLIAWLVAQPEVVFVRVERREASANVIREVAHG
jgi:Lon protease-like protein